MRKTVWILALAAVLMLTAACGHIPDAGKDASAVGEGMAALPFGSADVMGMDCGEAVEALQAAGFSEVGTVVLEDLTSQNALYDGAVERIEAGGRAEFRKGDELPADAEIVVTCHAVRRVEMPVFADEVRTGDAAELRQRLTDAGFVDVELSEVHDADPAGIEGMFANELTVNGSPEYRAGELVPFDAEIRIVTRYPMPQSAAAAETEDKPAASGGTTGKPYALPYTTNDSDTVKNGNAGVYAYRQKELGVYYIIDFDEGYTYSLAEELKECDRVKIESGNLKDGMAVVYHFSDRTLVYHIQFEFDSLPEIITVQDEEDSSFYSVECWGTDLDDALALRDTKTIVDY